MWKKNRKKMVMKMSLSNPWLIFMRAVKWAITVVLVLSNLSTLANLISLISR